MVIEYVFKHRVDGDFQYETFSINEVEDGRAKIYINAMLKDGYGLVERNYFEDQTY